MSLGYKQTRDESQDKYLFWEGIKAAPSRKNKKLTPFHIKYLTRCLNGLLYAFLCFETLSQTSKLLFVPHIIKSLQNWKKKRFMNPKCSRLNFNFTFYRVYSSRDSLWVNIESTASSPLQWHALYFRPLLCSCLTLLDLDSSLGLMTPPLLLGTYDSS